MKRVIVFMLAGIIAFGLSLSPDILEARSGHGGGGDHGGAYHGGYHGGYRGGYHGGYYHHGGWHYGHGGWDWGFAPFVGFGAGLLAGDWLNGYYYTYPYNGACQRWVPTGGYRTETRQDPGTGAWYTVQVPSGYWEWVPCY